MSLDHLSNWAIRPTPIIVQLGENESALGNDCPDHFVRKWLSYTNLLHWTILRNCSQLWTLKDDFLERWTILLDHYLEWLPRRMTVLDHSSTLATWVLNLAASTVILQWEAIWATLRLAREIWRINQSCEVLTKARGNIQPLWIKPKVKTNKMLCESNAKVRGNVQPLWA